MTLPSKILRLKPHPNYTLEQSLTGFQLCFVIVVQESRQELKGFKSIDMSLCLYICMFTFFPVRNIPSKISGFLKFLDLCNILAEMLLLINA